MAFFSFFNGNAQYVTTNNTSFPSTCDGSAAIFDTNAVVSVQGWYGNGDLIQDGGFYLLYLCPGNYTLSYTDSSNFSQSETFTIQSNPNPCEGFIATLSTTFTSTASSCDGSATILFSGGTAPYSFMWSVSPAINLEIYSSQATNLCSNSYLASVSDSFGCSQTLSFYISYDSVINPNCIGFYASMSTTDASSSSICDGTYAVSVFGGTAPYTYSLANGMTSQIASNLCPGSYSATVVDSAGCLTNALGIIGNNAGANPGDTIVFTGTLITDSTVVGTAISEWIDECAFDYNQISYAQVDSYQSFGDSTLVTWVIQTTSGALFYVDAFYQFNSGFGVYDIILQLTCGQKDNPKYLQINSQINYQLVGISENENPMFHLFPNPVQNELNITGLTEPSAYEIVDLNGRLILSGKIASEPTKIDVTNLCNGNYLFVIKNSKGVLHYNFVK